VGPAEGGRESPEARGELHGGGHRVRRLSLSVTVPDPDHSDPAESRYILIGLSERGRLLVVSYAERGTAIRIIGAREATRHEREHYEEGE
jgi:uncharacterized DUF497 family protein